ncbi:MAG: sugar ABC transporter permease [Treponema sp.]|jgi:multiple sugar transport system permease protein|nr:sugar ABC transporter permease [Treponema sp.]
MLKPNRSVILIFLGPAVLFYLIIFLYPTIRTIVMSFFAVESVSDPVSKWSFNGLGNYIKIFNTAIFIQSMKNIGRIWFFGGLGVMFLAMVFAMILTTENFKAAKFFRAVIYLPNVVSAVAMGTMWLNYVYNPEYGLLNSILSTLKIVESGQIHWTGPGLRFWSLLVAYCFGMVGYHMLIFISGIEQIPKDYHDSATMEGANIFQRFIHITLPFIRGVTRTNIVMWTVFIVGFFVWGQLFSPVNLSNDTVAPLNYMYQLVFGASSSANVVRDSGAGAAIGMTMMLIVIAVFFSTSLIVRKDDTEL